ncbi:MAG: formate/nitrite transporter family protein [Corynebacterium sp.]|nr:formate/nitrite transporter family protein [Corynebacterium sp.]
MVDDHERTQLRERPEEQVQHSYWHSTNEGEVRLHRSWRSLITTGLMGGVDLSIGIMAYLLTIEESGSHVLGGLAFSIAFVGLYLAHAELFTEGFFYPVVAVFSKRGTIGDLARLWVFTLLTNLLSGWVIIGFITVAFPQFHPLLAESAHHFLDIGLSWQGAALAILAGMAITLMTRMHAGSDHPVAVVAASIAGGIVLAGGSLFHSVLDSILIFGAIWSGAEGVTYLDWLGWVWWVIPLNIIGGVLFTTIPRVIRGAEVADR